MVVSTYARKIYVVVELSSFLIILDPVLLFQLLVKYLSSWQSKSYIELSLIKQSKSFPNSSSVKVYGSGSLCVNEEIWLQIIIVKPPWKLTDIFRCVEKHWIAVFGYVYPRDMREKMDHLSNLWKRYRAQNILEQKERETIAQSGICILQMIQRTRKQFYYSLEKAVEGIKVRTVIFSGLAVEM